MLKVTLAFVALSLPASGAWAAVGERIADAAPVIAAERAFAARAAEVGIAPSFLEFMTDDAIVLRPDPLLARAVYSGLPAGRLPKEGGTLLKWWPSFAGVARSGDLGFTTGPASIDGGPPGIFYFTVWSRQRDGGWKWVFDGGVSGDASKALNPGGSPTVLSPGDAKPLAPDVAMDQVRTAEIALAARARKSTTEAYKAVLAADTLVQGSASGPATSPDAVERELATRAKAISFGPIGGSASKAGDLAWTYGDARWDGGRGHYVRIWQRRSGRWTLVFDQILAVEKPG